MSNEHSLSSRPSAGRVLETARLFIERFDASDAEFILCLLNEAAFLQYIGDRGVRTVEDATAYLERGPIASYERHGFGLWRVSLKGGGPIGMCGLLKRDTLPDVDIGYAFLAASWGNGYAREAVDAVVQHARERLGLARLLAIVSPGNDRSVRLLDRAGFEAAGTTRLPPAEHDVLLFERWLEAHTR